MMNNINFDPTIKKVIQQHEEPLETIQIPVVVDNEQYIVRQQLLRRTEIVKTFEIRKLNETRTNFLQCDPLPSRPSTPPCNTINLEDITAAIRQANARERHVSFAGNVAASQPIIHISTQSQSQQLPRQGPTNCANIQEMMHWADTPPKEASPPFPLHCSTATSTSEISCSVLTRKKCVRIEQDRILFPSKKEHKTEEAPETGAPPEKSENSPDTGNSAREQLKRLKAEREYFC